VGNEFEIKNGMENGLETKWCNGHFRWSKSNQSDFIDFLVVKKTADLKKQDRNILIKKQYTDFINENHGWIIEDTSIGKESILIQSVVQEYHDGILLFD